MLRAHAPLLQRVYYFSYQSSCLKTPTTTGVAVQRLCSLKAVMKSPRWMAFVHPILPSPQRPQKPVLARVRNSIATCTFPRVDRTSIGTGTCRKERACERAWLVCYRFRPCNRRERFLSLWRKCRRYDRLRDENTTRSVTASPSSQYITILKQLLVLWPACAILLEELNEFLVQYNIINALLYTPI